MGGNHTAPRPGAVERMRVYLRITMLQNKQIGDIRRYIVTYKGPGKSSILR
jgi:hypothetical protein